MRVPRAERHRRADEDRTGNPIRVLGGEHEVPVGARGDGHRHRPLDPDSVENAQRVRCEQPIVIGLGLGRAV